MFRRDMPSLGVSAGRTIHVAAGNVKPADDDGFLQPAGPWPDHAVPLGFWHDEPVAVVVEEAAAGANWPEGRTWLARLPASRFALLSTALQVASWRRNHRYCGRCGSITTQVPGEFAMHCSSCGHRNYPRISPCIITLVTHGDELLLARSPRFPPGRYSTLAGFIEPGEDAEGAVRREVHEEVGLSLGRIRYFRSQAWPFPHSLMLGFYAEAASRRIMIDHEEIIDAAWFSPGHLPQLPPPYSISRALIETHLKGVARR
ncbi:NAD(+) diphosphatase [Aidingimonas halophila]|uniref:NAD(+) diphosphatase n=1 Tax=Aidingimonas halophila TaxID=574349 RepID=A0A1H3BGC6_9GAMM|nr:NAD(+) diphosphatase [Aidingimonas halophila]GHC26449.1 NADH pyrophosphatase [Aidingimonas halophila]SDX40768.1 NAD+ diphosphatase [Aidingimonas halophila]